MREIFLISTTGDIYSFGIRRLASYIKKHNSCKVNLLFCVFTGFSIKTLRQSTVNILSSKLVSQLINLVKDSDVIGLSVMDLTEPLAIDITSTLKNTYPNKTIIWGGIHPTTAPERCLEFADYICVGEGEKSLSDFLNAFSSNKDPLSVKGIWGKRSGKTIRNDPIPLTNSLDELGFPEFGFLNSYMPRGNKIVSLTNEIEKKLIGNTFWTMMTQGCPFNCSFCANSSLVSFNKDYARVRSYSVYNFIQYLKKIKKQYNVQSFFFWDDVLFNLPQNIISEFCKNWMENINLPFHILGVNPASFNEEKLDMMIAAGLKRIRMGIQAGFEPVRKKIFNRRYSNASIINISNTLSKKNISLCDYDFILDNPWETMEDRLEGLRLMSKMAPPFTINISHLTFFSGTELTDRAIKEGLLEKNYKSKANRIFVLNNDYINFLYAVYSVIHIPEKILKYLISKKIVKLNIFIPKFCFPLLFYLKYVKILFYRLYHRDPTNIPFSSCFFKKK